MRMIDILPEHVRDWVTTLKARGVSPSTVADNKVILSAIFTTALNDLPAPLQGRQDPACAGQAAHYHHAGALRQYLFGASRRRCPVAGGDRDRERPAVGRANRASGARPGLRLPDPDRESRRGGGAPEVPSRWRPVPDQGVPQGQGVPTVQAQRSDRREAATANTAGTPMPATGQRGGPRARTTREASAPSTPTATCTPSPRPTRPHLKPSPRSETVRCWVERPTDGPHGCLFCWPR